MIEKIKNKEKKMEKVICDGKVAVLISPRDCWAASYTWDKKTRDFAESKLFCPILVKAILNNENHNEIVKKAREIFNDEDIYVPEDLTIEWVPKNALFRVEEDDEWSGEYVVIFDKNNYIVA